MSRAVVRVRSNGSTWLRRCWSSSSDEPRQDHAPRTRSTRPPACCSPRSLQAGCPRGRKWTSCRPPPYRGRERMSLPPAQCNTQDNANGAMQHTCSTRRAVCHRLPTCLSRKVSRDNRRNDQHSLGDTTLGCGARRTREVTRHRTKRWPEMIGRRHAHTRCTHQ